MRRRTLNHRARQRPRWPRWRCRCPICFGRASARLDDELARGAGGVRGRARRADALLSLRCRGELPQGARARPGVRGGQGPARRGRESTAKSASACARSSRRSTSRSSTSASASWSSWRAPARRADGDLLPATSQPPGGSLGAVRRRRSGLGARGLDRRGRALHPPARGRPELGPGAQQPGLPGDGAGALRRGRGAVSHLRLRGARPGQPARLAGRAALPRRQVRGGARRARAGALDPPGLLRLVPASRGDRRLRGQAGGDPAARRAPGRALPARNEVGARVRGPLLRGLTSPGTSTPPGATASPPAPASRAVAECCSIAWHCSRAGRQRPTPRTPRWRRRSKRATQGRLRQGQRRGSRGARRCTTRACASSAQATSRAAAELFRAADERASYWGVDEGRLKLFNLLNLALALDRAGAAQEAEAVLAKVRAVNPAFAGNYEKIVARTIGRR